jgi:hypothetical protein
LPSERQVATWLGLALAFDIVALLALRLFWDAGWDWLWTCDRGPTKHGPNTCAHPNQILLLVPLGLPLPYWIYRWHRYSRSED